MVKEPAKKEGRQLRLDLEKWCKKGNNQHMGKERRKAKVQKFDLRARRRRRKEEEEGGVWSDGRLDVSDSLSDSELRSGAASGNIQNCEGQMEGVQWKKEMAKDSWDEKKTK